jgi:hypothetical protein
MCRSKQAGNQSAPAPGQMAVQGDHTPTNQVSWTTFHNRLYPMARLSAQYLVSHPGNANTVNGVRRRGGNNRATMRGAVTQANYWQRHAAPFSFCASVGPKPLLTS